MYHKHTHIFSISITTSMSTSIPIHVLIQIHIYMHIHIHTGQEYTVNSYEGHVFFFTAQNNKLLEYARVTCTEQQVLYLIQDPLNPPALEYLEHAEREEQFRKEYLNRTGMVYSGAWCVILCMGGDRV